MERKYILTDETKTFEDKVLHRIKAVRDFGIVKAGDLGGWIEKEENLSHEGCCWVADEAEIHDNAQICETSRVCDDVLVFGDAIVRGNTVINGNARVRGSAVINGNAIICGNAVINGNARICEKVMLYGNARISEDAVISGNARVSGNVIVRGNARILGNSKLFGNAIITTDGYIKRTEDLLVIGPVGSRNDFTTFYLTEGGKIMVACGCFNGTIEDFAKAVKETHENSIFATHYYKAIELAQLILSKPSQELHGF